MLYCPTSGFPGSFNGPYSKCLGSPGSQSETVSTKPTNKLQDDTLGKLGLDSFTAVGLANQLRSQLEENAPQGSALALSALAEQFLLPDYNLGNLLQANISDPDPQSSSVKANSESPAEAGQKMRSRQRLLELIFENSGGSFGNVTDDAMLQDLGIDSLSIIELQSEIGVSFGIEFKDDHLHLQSTVKEILSCVS